MIELKFVKSEQKELLWNIHQKYLYEMTNFYDDKMDAVGNYVYEYFDAYFFEQNRKVFLIYSEENLAGFAMINNHSYIGENPDYVLAEFTVFPMFRRKHIALDAINQIFKMLGGKWEIKFNEKNTPAKNLWQKITARYNPEIFHLNDCETVLSFLA